MTFRALPPAGQPIDVWQRQPPALDLPGYRLVWVSSGTAALAYSLLHRRLLYPEITSPQVIVPAYCCPDLLAAAQYAGYETVVVDIQADDTGFNLADLHTALNDRTLAVIAINFMGIAERLAEIRSLISGYERVALVEDNAQWFPMEPREHGLEGDYVTFSFGRGKAIGLLGGGLVALRDGLPEVAGFAIEAASAARAWPVKAWLVNQLSRPRLFYALTRLPMLKLGETRYHALEAIGAMPERILEAFEANYALYRARPAVVEGFFDALFEGSASNALAPLKSKRRRNLLRYPVLCRTSEQRDALLGILTQAGMGATGLYQKPLARVDGVAGLTKVVVPEETPGADAFASRLLTLPVHSGVSQSDMDVIAGILSDKG
ncbi:MAG: DegT/DnrJ/EryC1/StrS family aminotransferase [Saccharospirillum sp.]|nr:DegT/DnrJ/EryC1/StrS family aminotransferase [Saccharospirillum sp.]